VRVTIHTILNLKQIIGARQLDVELTDEARVKDLLFLMKTRWGEALSPHLFVEGTDTLIPHIRIMVNGRQIEYLDRTETLLREGDEVLILPLVAGG
jgi:sulfur-carrier protein